MERITSPVADPDPPLDLLFSALADPTRRALLARLMEGEKSVAELAAPFSMSQPAVSKHLAVLERAGLITRGVDKQRRPARLNARPLREAVLFLNTFHRFWGESLDALDALLGEMQATPNTEEKDD